MSSNLAESGNTAARKILAYQHCAATMTMLRQQGCRIVLCHGVFDLLHPGHVAHLQEARALGDRLVVSITSAPHVNRGPGRPIFSDELRARTLASLECVDHVVIAPTATAVEMIDQIRPDIYCKGHEFTDLSNDVTNAVAAEAHRVRLHGGEMRYTGEVVFSSTRLLNNWFDALPAGVADYARKFKQTCSLEDLCRRVDSLSRLNVLVVGECIIDEYVHCTVEGVTAKGREISARANRTERHIGGALAIARHAAEYCGSVRALGIVGRDPAAAMIGPEVEADFELDLVEDLQYRTPVKRRYVERQGRRSDYSRLFSTSNLDPKGPSARARGALHERLSAAIEHCDAVLVADFGNGLLNGPLIESIQQKAPLLALKCQTNTANHGYNLVTKYHRADTFCLDERELRLATGSREGDPLELLKQLRLQLGARQCWLTLGSEGALALDHRNHEDRCPALTLEVCDTTGASDAHFTLAALSSLAGLPLEVGSLLGNLAGGLAANVLGNAQPVQRSRLLKFATTVMKI